MNNYNFPKIFFSAICLVFIVSKVVLAATYYVSPNGNDSYIGSIEKPLKSVTLALSRVKPGDSLILLDGTYKVVAAKKEAFLSITTGGSEHEPVTIKALNYGKAIIDGGNTIKYGFLINASNVTIEGFEIKNFLYFGIFVKQPNVVIKRNIIHHNGQAPISHAWGTGGIFYGKEAHDGVIDSNMIYLNGRLNLSAKDHYGTYDHGIYVCASEIKIYNNLIHDNQAYGLQIAGSYNANRIIISNNTIINQRNRGGIVLWKKAAKNCVIQNNIIAGNNGAAVKFLKDGGNNIVRNNIFWDNKAGDFSGAKTHYSAINNINRAPLLDESYKLKKGSPAIGKGTPDLAPPYDLEGNNRGDNEIDIGCFQDVSFQKLTYPKNLRVISYTSN